MTLTVAGFNWASLGVVPGVDRRPDGDDLLFGGAGMREDRNDDTCVSQACASGVTASPGHARDADTIVGDNGRIVRIVGINGVDLAPADAVDQRYVRFIYDNYCGDRLRREREDRRPRRAPARLHAGRPRLPARPVLRARHADPACNDAGPDATGNCSTPLASVAGRRCHGNIGVATDPADLTASKYVDIGGRDEVHGEASDDTVYTGCGNDVIYGDAQDDDLIGGWGNDWISGGTGQDGILGDDGRIFTSRNSSSGVNAAGAACTAGFTQLGPHTFRPNETASASRSTASAALVPTDPDDDRSQG